MSGNLLSYREDVHTSIGNDGVIKEIFKRLNISNGYFCEFGAWDGLKGCNSRLLYESGWKGVFIEPKLNRWLKLKYNYLNDQEVKCIRSIVEPDGHKSLKNIFSKTKVTRDIDFLSIDIDGRDLEIVESLESIMPKVICMEGGQMLDPYHPPIDKDIAAKNIQQSLSTIESAANLLGYFIACSYQDTFLIRNDFKHFFPQDSSILEIYFEGLRNSPRRLPWILKIVNDQGLDNEIIKMILDQSNFKHYGFENRAKWHTDNLDYIGESISNVEKFFITKKQQ